MKTPFEKLTAYSRDIYAFRSAIGLLSWDQETMMPAKGADGRARAMEALSRVLHQKYSDDRFRGLLDDCAQAGNPDPRAAAIVRELRRDRDRAVKVPEDLAAEIARTVSLSQRAWADARPKDDTKSFNPWLAKVIALRRREAEYLGYEQSPYDALLEGYEPGARASQLKVLLADLKRELVPLLSKIMGSRTSDANPLTDRAFPIPGQKIFNRQILTDMGFDLEAGRLDESAHPFTEGVHPQDVRLTTRYRETDPMSALFGTLHEGGHGLYEQGFLPEFFGTPMAEAVSLGVHESQSRLWENQVGRSRDFWSHYLPKFRAAFPEQLSDLSLDAFLRAVNQVKPSLIRVEADEVTYNLHVVIRFQLELALFEGQLEVDGIEAAWNDSMRENLGLVPPRPADGYMQDVHWSCGLLGYFPTYTLGNLRAAQLFSALRRALPGLPEDIRQGRFEAIRQWLGENVHRHGREFQGEDLMERATGEITAIGPFVAYLKDKYSGLYGISL